MFMVKDLKIGNTQGGAIDDVVEDCGCDTYFFNSEDKAIEKFNSLCEEYQEQVDEFGEEGYCEVREINPDTKEYSIWGCDAEGTYHTVSIEKIKTED